MTKHGRVGDLHGLPPVRLFGRCAAESVRRRHLQQELRRLSRTGRRRDGQLCRRRLAGGMRQRRRLAADARNQGRRREPVPAATRATRPRWERTSIPTTTLWQASTIKDSCDADGSESQVGTTGLDNDGDGQRDASDSDCGQFGINAGMNDAWYSPATSGQGFLITVFEDAGLVFLAWFTFDVERPPADVTAILGDPGHRWVTAQGPFSGDTATLNVTVTSGGVFDSPEPPVQQRAGRHHDDQVERLHQRDTDVRHSVRGSG